ncbi:hypothetical protein AAMO2058_000690800 [Amorphochlora amoebiformis]
MVSSRWILGSLSILNMTLIFCTVSGSIEHDPVFDNVTPTTDDSHLAEAGVFVLRQYLSEEDQQMFYEGLVSVAQEADVTEIDQLQEAGCPFPAAPFPFLMYNNPTTKSGNISEVPIFALDLAQGAYDSAMAAGEKKGLQSPPQKTMNSCHAQLYPVGGCMAPHKDTGGSWGLSISLGASALFRVDQLVLRLNSGDVVIANFGGRVHSVRLRSPKTAPEWWTNSRFTYGAARCNVQFRCAGDYTGPKEVHIPWSRTAVWLHKLARFLR